MPFLLLCSPPRRTGSFSISLCQKVWEMVQTVEPILPHVFFFRRQRVRSLPIRDQPKAHEHGGHCKAAGSDPAVTAKVGLVYRRDYATSRGGRGRGRGRGSQGQRGRGSEGVEPSASTPGEFSEIYSVEYRVRLQSRTL
jgi:hypothetical protein